jgi:L-lysine 2,3-aminomutase
MVMSAQSLTRCIEPLLAPELSHVSSIRIGTKSLSYWPHRYTSAPDADELSRLFERITRSGRSLALMAHVSHPRELATVDAQKAISRIRSTGAVLRTQAPLIRTVNDDPGTWADMWKSTVRLGAVPYYMFIERDTGPHEYFQVPLARAWEIFRDAYASVSGLARTVRGPAMSGSPGKVCIDGLAETDGQRVFVLHYIQARDPSWVGRPFFAKYDQTAAWLSDLRPASTHSGQFSGGL